MHHMAVAFDEEAVGHFDLADIGDAADIVYASSALAGILPPLHQGDALRLDWPALLAAPPYRLVANLPYNISSQILFKILDHHRLPPQFVQLVRDQPSENAARAAGRERHDKVHGIRREA